MNVEVHDYFTVKRNCIKYGEYENLEIALEFAKQMKKERPEADIVIKKVTEIECEVTKL